MSENGGGSDFEDFDGDAGDYGDFDDFGEGDNYFEDMDEAAHEKEEPNFQILKPEDLVKEQSEAIQAVVDIFAVPDYTARQLLTFLKWNKDRLIERYYGGEADQIFKQSGIINPTKKKKLKKLERTAVIECTICLTDTKVSKMTRIPCGHIFCNECWIEYIKTKIYDGAVTEIFCAAKGCKTQMDEVTIVKLIGKTSELKEKYYHLVSQAYVRDNKNIRWCPGKDCENAIRVQLLKDKEVVCDCGTKFCFGCGELPHAPADCTMIKEWNKKNQSDGEDAKWIASFTKECPKCSSMIHKDGGCQYMTCGHCSHRFCWMCLGTFDHKDHACNKLKEESGVDPNSSRAKLNKYIFFFTRYQNHQQSFLLEDKLMGKAQKIMQDLTDKGISWIDVQFIKQATQSLMECRNMLKYTYVYGHYLPKQVNRSIFEYLQADLESAVEKLSELLEAPGDIDRLKVINASTYVRQRQKNLLQGLMEGEITGKGGADDDKVYKNTVEVYDGWVYKSGS